MRLSNKDVFFLSCRLTITMSLVFYLGILSGTLLIYSYYTLNFFIMKYVFGLEAVAPVDTLLIHDDDKNIANVISKANSHLIVYIGAIIMEKYDTDQFIKFLYAKVERLFRAKAKLVKILGKYYYKKIDEKEFKEKFP